MTPEPASDPVADRLEQVTPTGIDSVPEHDDPLAEALHHLRMDGMFYCRSELTAPWGLKLPSMPECLWFHVVTRGEFVLIDSNDEVHRVRAGEVLVLPHGTEHRAGDTADRAMPIVFDLPHHYVSRHYAVLRHGGDDGNDPGPEAPEAIDRESGSGSATVICGVVHLGHPVARMLLAALPEIIRVETEPSTGQWDWLPNLLALMAVEAQQPGLGGETIITRLSDVLIIHTIRSWIETNQADQTGWLRALGDPLIGRAIALVHRDPARDWTVATLAAEVGMSRSSLSARFSELVGRSPKQYITDWRMQVAQDLLREPEHSLAEIAVALGYRSEAAFSRAFKRETGLAPSRARVRTDVIELGRQWATPTEI